MRDEDNEEIGQNKKGCKMKCVDAKCFAWSYVTKNHPTVNYHRNCHLKDSTYHERKTASEGVLSGAKGCGMGKYMFLSFPLQVSHRFQLENITHKMNK